ncbi:Flp pilus assembly protein CpaB [Ammoniphilus sp. CFH 90114]|uniref:Flp pilus assembly protein CpaB n=1 Tax=Ammoniphilus sp. CFH 90114 TaxID=2493665 RepID=UPI00100FBC52|nr:SAF domain-containing protein [Ammoniphilus sp. CFH 90114]RXT07835.1 hypothetical protein EIZ39_10420 [Ammoniphilus sp. CFH 90114]
MFESRKRVFIFTILSVSFALAAAFLFSNYMNETKRNLGELVSIYVAQKDIPAGSPIQTDMLTTMEVPVKYASASFLQSAEDFKNKISLVPIPSGEVLTTAMLRDISNVPSQHRLVQLRTPMAIFDDQVDVLDRVDLYGSYELAGNGNPAADSRMTDLLLTDVEVLRVTKQDGTINAIGVALTQEQAKRVIWMLNYGKEIRVLKSNNTLVK